MEFSKNAYFFQTKYEYRTVSVVVEPGESGYGIYFDQQLIAELEEEDDGQWNPASGELDRFTANRIGFRIKAHYRKK